MDLFPSPFLDAYYESTLVRIVIDGGATGDFMSLSEAKCLGANIKKSSMKALQVDGGCKLDVVGRRFAGDTSTWNIIQILHSINI